MTVDLIKGMEPHLYPVEKLVPSFDWLAFLMKVAYRCEVKYPLKFSMAGYNYNHLDYWRVLVFRVLTQLPTKEATDELNDLLWDLAPTGENDPNRLKGSVERYERRTPHVTQIDEFLSRLPKKFKEQLTEEIFHTLMDVALELGLIEKSLVLYFDYTNKWYYGLVNGYYDDEVMGTNKGPGTKWTRKYGAVMAASGTTKLFIGIFLLRKGMSKVPDIFRMKMLLEQWGFHIQYIEGDREISTYDLIASLYQEGIPYLGTMKRTPSIKPLVEDYFDGKIPSVIPFVLKQNAGTVYKWGDIPTMLIFKTDPHTRLRDLQKQVQMGEITREKALEHIHIFITTLKPPRNKHQWGKWGSGLAQRFRKRWRIECGFRDMNQIPPASHARNHGTKTLMFAFQMWGYDLWQIQRALHRRLRRVPKTWRKGPSLVRFSKRLRNQMKLSASLET